MKVFYALAGLLPFLSPVVGGFASMKGLEKGRREAFLTVFLFAGVFITCSTEALSHFSAISFPWVLSLWISALVFGCVWYVSKKEPVHWPEWGSLPSYDKYLLYGVIFIIAVTGFITYIAPGSKWDSMTYHMSRVMHWIQNRSVEHYPTHILRQLHQSPWAEFGIMHAVILNGGDRYAGFIQSFAMICSIMGVSLIAQKLGAGRNGQILAAFVAATLPIGIVQSSGTQTDYACALWLVLFVYFMIKLKERPDLYTSVRAGSALGLAILTKGTAYVYALPFLLFYTVGGLKEHRAKMAGHGVIIMLCVVFLNMGHCWRNYDLYGSPFGPGDDIGNIYTNESMSFPEFVSNVARNASLHASTPFEGVNRIAENAVIYLHIFLGIGLNDKNTTWFMPYYKGFEVEKTVIGEDLAPNTLHMVLAVLSLIILFVIKGSFYRNERLRYAAAAVSAFFLFCIIFKWQPWHSRLHLPVFVLMAPLAAVTVGELKRRRIAAICAALLFAGALPFIFLNKYRPLIGEDSILTVNRTKIYFMIKPYAEYYPYVQNNFENTVNFLVSKNISSLGLMLGENDWEYQFWVLMKERSRTNVRIEHFRVTNVSAKKQAADNEFLPDAVVLSSIGMSYNSPDAAYIRTHPAYSRVRIFGYITVFLKNSGGGLLYNQE